MGQWIFWKVPFATALRNIPWKEHAYLYLFIKIRCYLVYGKHFFFFFLEIVDGKYDENGFSAFEISMHSHHQYIGYLDWIKI